MKKNFSDFLNWHEEYGWQIFDTQINAMDFGGPS